MIRVFSKGDFNKTTTYLKGLLHRDHYSDLDHYGRLGVDALSRATPIDTGLASTSWGYRIIKTPGRTGIEWFNTDIVNDIPIVILLQYGHGTRNGGYVQGRDFINPAIRPIFDQISQDVWKKVRS